MKTLKIPVLALFAALSLAACDGDGTGAGDLREGRFEGEISGALDIDVRGDAESGDAFDSGDHDLIVLTDFSRDVQIVIWDSEGEFSTGRRSIEDEEDFDSRILGYVIDLETGEGFGSVNGTLDLDRVSNGGIAGSARFTAESDEQFGDFITVDVIFNTDYSTSIDFSRSPSFSRAEKR
ncbi:MAG TPA: hypothetical protein VK358_13265 [Longimicrobium sp.]|nr:hypothetical protein [Longimicrobium sp.]